MADSAPLPNRRQTSREHVSRIDRTYFQRASRFQITRRRLILAALVAGAAWAAWSSIDAALHVAPGPVHATHAKWEKDCSACHVPFSPIKDNTWLSSIETRQAMDAKCEACHRRAPHHPLEIAAEVGSCASCHADHRGRTADITRVADRTCTACHADIAAHRLSPGGGETAHTTASVSRFDSEHHPPFASLTADPGRLKFSHGRHMLPGLTYRAADGHGADSRRGDARSGPWTYAMLPTSDRRRYQPAGAHEGDLVQLDCGSCHEFGPSLSAGDARTVSGRLAAAEPGAYALPVDFGRHCAACHPLPFEGVADGSEDHNRPASRPDAVVPHGLDAVGLARALESAALKDVIADGRPLLDAPRPPRPLPSPRAGAAHDPQVRSLVRERLDATVGFTRGTCGKCHDVRDAALPDAAGLLTLPAAESPRWFEVVPTAVPDVWLAKARFNHRAHQSYSCRECHAAAYPDESGQPPLGSPLDHSTVMIAGRDSCVACHAPAGSDPHTGRPVGGARFDCVECHGYHGLGPHSQVAPAPVTRAASGRPGADGW